MDSLFWGYFSRISNIASSLVIMPFALTSMSSEYFSIWMIFIVFFGLIQTFDFGCVSTFDHDNLTMLLLVHQKFLLVHLLNQILKKLISIKASLLT